MDSISKMMKLTFLLISLLASFGNSAVSIEKKLRFAVHSHKLLSATSTNNCTISILQNNFELYYKSATLEINPDYGNGSLELRNNRYFTLDGMALKEVDTLFVS